MTVAPRRDELRLDRVGVARHGLTRRVTGGDSFTASSTAAASAVPRSAARRSTIQSGIDERMPIDAVSSPSGNGHGGPAAASARSTALTKPFARGDTACIAATVSPTAACADTPLHSW